MRKKRTPNERIREEIAWLLETARKDVPPGDGAYRVMVTRYSLVSTATRIRRALKELEREAQPQRRSE